MRRAVGRRVLGWVLAGGMVVAGCSDDDDDGAIPPPDPLPEVTATTQPPNPCGLEVPSIPETVPAAICALGFGVPVPEGWQAALLTADALEDLAEAPLADPSFLDAARNVAATGAVFYAAGVDQEGRVAELKVDVRAGADTSPEGVRAEVDAVVAELETVAGSEGAVEVVDDLDDGRIRVDYRLQLTDADGGAPIEAVGSQLFVPGDDRLFAVIVTSEDDATQAALLDVFQTGFVLVP